MIEPERVPFAAGDYVTRYPAGHNYTLRIDAPFEKPGWQTRTFSPAGQIIFPGSTVEFEGKLYEIVFQDYDPRPRLTIRYYLNPWEDRFPIRNQFHYNKEECFHTARLYRSHLANNRQRLLWMWLAPFTGMLPAEDQIRIANKYGLRPTRMTLISALSILPAAGFAILFLMLGLIHGVPLPGPAWMHLLYPAGFYFFAESLLRMLTASSLEEPIGSLIVSFPVLLWRSIRESFDPAARQKSFEKLKPRDSLERHALATATDQVLAPADEQHLEIISLLPKPHWNSRVAIAVNGIWYGLVRTRTQKEGKQITYRFLLKRAPEGMWFASVIDYDPEEVQQLYRQKRRQELKTWVDTFAFLWGLLSREEQTRLEELYEFDSLKFTRITVLGLCLLAFANLTVSVINLIARVATGLDVWLLLLSGYFLLESFSRWKEWKDGEPSGSILGFLVRPFARNILAGL